jgi:UDP-galactopyranose mutase
MMPYNFKVWAHPPRMMNKEWIGERVSVVDIKRVLGNVILDRDDAGWGPNSTFKYPLYGGTGGLFERMRPYVEENLRLGAPVVRVDVDAKEVTLEDGTRESYDVLMSTMPMDKLVAMTDGATPDLVKGEAERLRHSGSFIVGVGVNQPVPSKKCWMYFPEGNAPFYRVTYLSNYSPEVVPDATRQYSLLAEVSHSEFKPENRHAIVDETLRGMVNTKLLREEDLADVVDTFLIERDYTYPTPSLERDQALRTIHPWLESKDVYSRGRFGAWRYEVGNMDHSVAQGVEWVNRIVCKDVENELTYLAKRGC